MMRVVQHFFGFLFQLAGRLKARSKGPFASDMIDTLSQRWTGRHWHWHLLHDAWGVQRQRKHHDKHGDRHQPVQQL
jgi:hypothetical protein